MYVPTQENPDYSPQAPATSLHAAIKSIAIAAATASPSALSRQPYDRPLAPTTASASEKWFAATWVVPVAWGLALYCVLSMLLLCSLYGQGVVDARLNVSQRGARLFIFIRWGAADGLQYIPRHLRRARAVYPYPHVQAHMHAVGAALSPRPDFVSHSQSSVMRFVREFDDLYPDGQQMASVAGAQQDMGYMREPEMDRASGRTAGAGRIGSDVNRMEQALAAVGVL